MIGEYAIILAVMSVPLAMGWLGLRALARRDTAARDLHQLSQEVAALIEQNALLADELTELARESRVASRLVGSEGSLAPGAKATPPHTARS